MLLTPNRNGTSREALIEQRRRVARAIRDLQGAMHDAWPNGRDYQLRPENERLDLAEWREFADRLRAFYRKIEDEAIRLTRLDH